MPQPDIRLPEQLDLTLVAKAIARVIARKHVSGDPKLRLLDPMRKAAAIGAMVEGMWPDLDEEAHAAAHEVLGQISEPVR